MATLPMASILTVAGWHTSDHNIVVSHKHHVAVQHENTDIHKRMRTVSTCTLVISGPCAKKQYPSINPLAHPGYTHVHNCVIPINLNMNWKKKIIRMHITLNYTGASF